MDSACAGHLVASRGPLGSARTCHANPRTTRLLTYWLGAFHRLSRARSRSTALRATSDAGHRARENRGMVASRVSTKLRTCTARRGMAMSQSRPVLGVVMDPIETIKPKKDSTLAMMLAAQRAGWSLVYFRQQDLLVRDGAPLGQGATSRFATTPTLVRARRLLERRARAARRAADAQGPAVRHGVHLHDVHPRARRASGPARRQQAVEPPRHQREGLYRVVPAVHAAEPRDPIAHRAAGVPDRARPDRAEAVRRHGRALDLRREPPAT